MLPESKQLNVEALEKLFSHMSQSYKLFWFRAILELNLRKKEFVFEEVVDYMIFYAWDMTKYARSCWGKADALGLIVNHLCDAEVNLQSSREAFLQVLRDSDSRFVKDKKRILITNVPYRIHAPFLSWKPVEWKNPASQIIQMLNETEGLIYRFGGGNGLMREVIINNDWRTYFTKFHEELVSWVCKETERYLSR